MEKNPIIIIYLARKNLLPINLWVSFALFVILLITITFVIPDNIIFIDYNVLDTSQFLLISCSALTFILSMYTFGREVYTTKDFAQIYLKNKNVYYGYLADYLFPALLWCLIAFLSVCKLIVVMNISVWLLDLLRIIFISITSLAMITTITLVIHNMNRVSNKVVIESKQLEKE
ncbi:hypothetical protein [Streptococcus sobrinus]|uniref:DUF2975 domain-containing protein n=1 Tax=Streptococcus sobrinus TaxID=1310 RepID=A0ABN5LVL2_9STRE|nr:hypothetical protein [Streptococcus sobrinus]AWN21794.1 hypothetical protein DK182_07975 [Streptococcus sobrinus]SQG14091.1 Uncharacterised protein [Streptococcus sobrinus]